MTTQGRAPTATVLLSAKLVPPTTMVVSGFALVGPVVGATDLTTGGAYSLLIAVVFVHSLRWPPTSTCQERGPPKPSLVLAQCKKLPSPKVGDAFTWQAPAPGQQRSHLSALLPQHPDDEAFSFTTHCSPFGIGLVAVPLHASLWQTFSHPLEESFALNSLPYSYVTSTGVPTGPKLIPKIFTGLLPSESMLVAPSRAEIDGGPYEVTPPTIVSAFAAPATLAVSVTFHS